MIITGPGDQRQKLSKIWKLKIATALNMEVEGQNLVKKLRSKTEIGARRTKPSYYGQWIWICFFFVRLEVLAQGWGIRHEILAQGWGIRLEIFENV